MATTAILSALAQEQQGLLAQLSDARHIRRAGRDFWTGELRGAPVVLALSRIGKVAAATTATTLIEAFGADRIVFTGVAGALGPAAVAQVCHDYGIAFAAVRTISDRADDLAHVDFERFINDVAGVYALRILAHFLGRLADSQPATGHRPTPGALAPD